MRILVLLLCCSLGLALYLVIGWRHRSLAGPAASAAAGSATSSVQAEDPRELRAALDAVAQRLDALARDVTALRESDARTRPTAQDDRRGQPLTDDEFRRAYRDTIVKIMGEERERQSFGDRDALLRGSVHRYLAANRLENDAHAEEWHRILEEARTRSDELRVRLAPGRAEGQDSEAQRAEWKSAWTALRAETYAKLSPTLAAQHVDVLLDLVFNF